MKTREELILEVRVVRGSAKFIEKLPEGLHEKAEILKNGLVSIKVKYGRGLTRGRKGDLLDLLDKFKAKYTLSCDIIDLPVLKVENLIILDSDGTNGSFISVESLDGFLKVDLENHTWSYMDWDNVDIGRSRSIYDNYHFKNTIGVLGVYDKNNPEHMKRAEKDKKRIPGL